MTKKKKKILPSDQMKFNLLKRLLRSVFRYLPEFREVFELRKSKTQGKKHFFTCDVCRGDFTRKELAVDHVRPIGGYYKWKLSGATLGSLVELVWCNVNNLQLLCVECHRLKTKEERAVNAQHKKQWQNKFTNGC